MEAIILHERYDISTFDHDIALLKIKGKIQYGSAAKPICLPKQGHEFSHSRKCYLAGWGHEKDGGELTKALQEVEVSKFFKAIVEENYSISKYCFIRMFSLSSILYLKVIVTLLCVG